MHDDTGILSTFNNEQRKGKLVRIITIHILKVTIVIFTLLSIYKSTACAFCINIRRKKCMLYVFRIIGQCTTTKGDFHFEESKKEKRKRNWYKEA